MRHRLSPAFFRLFAAAVAVLLAAGLITAPSASAAGPASISGTVRAAVDDSPLAGATVKAFLTPDVSTPAALATTAADGTYTLSGLGAGTYKIQFTANNAAYQAQWYWSAHSATDAQPLTLASGDSIPFVDGYLADATTSLSGTVYDGSNAPIQGVTVGMYSTGDTTHPVYTTPTAVDGTYSFTGIAPGTYLLRFTGDSDLFADDWYYNSPNPAGAFSITVNPGDHDTGYDQNLSDVTASLSGAVYASDDVTPISGATVELYDSSNTGAPVATTTTAADGSYRFAGMAPNTYKLRVSADPSLYSPKWYYNSTDPEDAYNITVNPGDHLPGWNLYLDDATTSLDGIVYASDNVTPISGATVGLYSSSDTGAPVATTTSAADGSYRFAGMAPDDYKLRVSADPSLYQAQWYYNSSDPEDAYDITIDPGTHDSGWNFQLADATMSIGGNVYDQSFSAPLKGATVQLFASADPATALATTTTVGDGSYLFSGLTAGNYLVEFTDAPLFTPQWYSFATDPGDATEITLIPGQHPGAYGYLTPSADWAAYGSVGITGTPSVGSTLTAVPAGWSPAPTTYQYAWFIDGTQVPVGTASTFTVTPAAAQHNVTVAVTAVRANYPTSSATASVSVPQGTFSPGTPTISGTTKVGSTLTASPGTWSPTPDRFTYQWNVSGSSSLTSTTATAAIPDWALGNKITVAVTAHRYGYPDVTRSSVQTAAVTAGSLTTSTPLIAGTPVVGVTLSATPGTWGPAPGITYQWKSSGTAISGATGSTFTPTATQLGHPITVTVTGTQSGYTTASTTSLATSNVGLGTLSATTPTIAGSPVVGGTLTAVPGKWRPYPVVMSYQWYVGGAAFPGATAQTFVIPGSAAGQAISVAATGSETGYTPTTLTSAATAAVTGGALSGPTPTITGNPQVGATLTANPGTWAPAPVVLGYQWAAGGTNITGATSSTLIVPASALGKTITVTVTASKSGFATQAKTSAVTAAVIAGVLTTATPTISGSPSVGSSLTALPGSWGPGSVAFIYQWKANGTAISGATASTFTLTAAQLGSTITVAVTGSETGYAAATVESAATATIVGSTFTTIGTPTITGTAVVGGTLTAGTGTWAPTPDSYSYQWKANGTAISGATASTYVAAASVVGQTITVTVTAHKTAFADASATSPATAAVGAGTLTAPTPTIGGSAVVGGILTAVPGVWGPGPVALTYQWKAGGTAISGATASTFTITAAQLGSTITVAVTGSETGYATATVESAATATIVGSTFTTIGTPTITGTPVVGGTLTAGTGTWAPTPDSYSYQWKANGTAISGATASTYVAAASVVGQTITVTVTAHKTGYADASATSAATAAVAAGTLTAPTPTITGSPFVGATLTAHSGSWGPGSVTLTYQWKASGTTISGATGTTYVPMAGDFGKTITVAVTGTEPGYTTATVESAATVAIAAAAFDTVGSPTISGTPVVGGTLTAGTGTWAPTPDSYTYQWKAGGTAISGAASSTFTLTGAQLGVTVTVTVTAHKSGYADASATSPATAAVAAGALTALTPTITGSAVVGGILTAVPGVWGPGTVALTYQWKAGGTNISGATASTFTITPAQLGQTITVAVTGTETGYATATKESVATAAVAAGALTAPTPTISGTAVVGGILTALPGVWGPGTVALTYQWKAGGTDISGATASTFTITPAQLGQTITVAVTGTETGYTSATKESPATAPVAQGATGTISGKVIDTHGNPVSNIDVCLITSIGDEFMMTPDANGEFSFTDEPVGTYTMLFLNSGGSGFCVVAIGSTPTYQGQYYQWMSNSLNATPIVVTAAQPSVVLNTVTLTAIGEQYNYAKPTITGTATVGATLTAHAGSWFPAPGSVTLQWKANGVAIAGATNSSYTLTGAEAGKAITVTETAAGPTVTTSSATSAATAAVAPGTLTAPTPTITGTAKVGSTLTAVPGTWAPAPVTLTYQWKANSASISGATGSSYTPTATQLNQTITVTVTGSKVGYTAAGKTSAATAAVAPGTLTSPTPTITGTAKVGSTLTVAPGTWAPSPVTLTYQWKANNTSISGATAGSYVVAASLVGKTITVTVTGAKSGYTTTAKASASTVAVVAGTLAAPTPTITGTAKVGSVLTAHPGTWAPSPVTLTYQWKQNGIVISGATGATYTVAAGYVGKKITVTVTGTKTGYATTAKTSISTATVVAGTLTAPTPTITGTVKVGSVLTAHSGTWAPAPVTLSYQWKANGSNISGATHSTYTVAASLVGRKITVTVSGTKTGYTTTAKTSASTVAVAAGTLTAQVPSISGTAKVGKTLTANPGTWAPAPVTLTYQWKANGLNISGATAKTYVISSSVKGKKITVTVTGTKAGYTTVAKTSLSTAIVS